MAAWTDVSKTRILIVLLGIFCLCYFASQTQTEADEVNSSQKITGYSGSREQPGVVMAEAASGNPLISHPIPTLDPDTKQYTQSKAYFDYYINTEPWVGGELNVYFFKDWIQPKSSVMDFGAGGGFLLKFAPTSGKKIGVEINPYGREYANTISKVNVVGSLKEVQDASVDVVISCHVLEHLENPTSTLAEIRRKIKPGGRAVFILPGDTNRFDMPYDVDNPDHHLYEWSPLTLGNLFFSAGFKVERVERLPYSWYEGNYELFKKSGAEAWMAKARQMNTNPQLRIVAVA